MVLYATGLKNIENMAKMLSFEKIKSIPVPDKSAISAPPLPTLTKDEREELEQLRVENAYLKKLTSLGSAENMLNVQGKVSIVNELKARNSALSRLLIVSGLPRSTFYYHVRRLAAPDRYQSARALVLKNLSPAQRPLYGYRRIRLACRNEGFT
ncbi:hypothetical protein O5258_12505 [Escherichia coli]|nr:hypothetical protein [Escherichia coli]